MSRSNRLRPLSLMAVVALMAAGAGCPGATGDIDQATSPVTLIVSSVTPASAPFGDVISDAGTLFDDTIQVTFISRMKASSDITQPALQDIVIDRYEVSFERLDGGSDVPAGFQRGMNAKVRVTPHSAQTEQFTTVTLVVLPSTQKGQPPISQLISPGFESATGFTNIQVNANLRFFGKTIAGDPIAASAQIGINIANFAG